MQARIGQVVREWRVASVDTPTARPSAAVHASVFELRWVFGRNEGM